MTLGLEIDSIVFLSSFLTVAFAWSMQEILDRTFGLRSTIILSKDIPIVASTLHPNDDEKRQNAERMIVQLTKRIDGNNYYRMEPRATVYIVKAMWYIVK